MCEMWVMRDVSDVMRCVTWMMSVMWLDAW